MRRAVVTGAVVVVLSGALAFAATPKGAWEGYGVGTWVHLKTTATSPGTEEAPQVTEQRQSLVKITDEEWVVRTETKAGDAWTDASEFGWPRKATNAATPPQEAPKTEDLGTEKVTVEGKEHACKKTRMVVPIPGGDAASASTTTVWASEEHGVLKTQTESPGNATLMEVTALAKKVKVGDKEVSCRETKTTSKGIGMDMTIVTLTSEAVPGSVVRSESTTSMSGLKRHEVSELVAYEIK